MIKIDKTIVQDITWEQDPDNFDRRLHALGQGKDEFVVVNPAYDPWILGYIDPTEIASDKCVVWAIDNLWLVKKFKRSWTEAKGWDLVHCELDIEKTVEFNPDVKFLNAALREQINNFKIGIEDLHVEHVWYVDPAFVDSNDKIWLAKVSAAEVEITGFKDMGYVAPVLLYNPDLPRVEYDVKLNLPFYHHDFNYELVWYLDDRLNHDSTFQHEYEENKIWLAKFVPDARAGYKEMGSVLPVLERNPDVPDVEFDVNLSIPYQDLVYEHVWYLDKKFNYDPAMIWAVRIRPNNPAGTKNMGFVSPVLERNPAVPDIEFDINISIPYQDLVFQHEWYLDPKFNFEHDNIWVYRIKPKFSEGFKSQGYISPKLEFNPAMPAVEYDIETRIPYQDLKYEHVWYLDSKFNPEDSKVWVAKITPRSSSGVKDMGFVKPVLEYNPDIPKIEFDFDFDLPYYDFDYNYEMTWYLNPKFSAGIDHVWAARLKPVNSHGVKDMGYVGPKIIYNNDIPKLNYYINDEIPYYDLNYEHVWMLPDELHTDVEKIWAAKIVPAFQPIGVKQMGNIGVALDNFDVVFISYNEPNAEANWQRVLEICPTAKRVKNVKGIFEAHKAAAELATTDMFYVVDGDAELVDNWKFDYRPNVFNMDCVHLWTSINPINDLEYGWGGVKLFPRKLLLDATTWKVDLTTGLGKLIYLTKISNVNTFNTGPFNTWRSAFRECAKLSAKLKQGFSTDHEREDAEHRLKVWNTVGQDRPYGDYAIEGAKQGTEFGTTNFNDLDKLKLINDYDWMKHEFNEFYKHQ